MKLFKSSTLSLRLTKLIALFTVCLFFLFSMSTFFIAYSLEDVMFNQQLLKANEQFKQENTLPWGINKKVDLSGFELSLSPNKQFVEFDADSIFGEFSHNNKHYHYMKITDGILLMDVTEQVIVKRIAKDIFTIILLLFIPCLFLSFFIARGISRHALKPFHRLSEHFQKKHHRQGSLAHRQLAQNIDIEESDVKEIAMQLEQALAHQQQLIEEQMTFNQGMSHEIRTPLQVMKHSVELIEANSPDLYYQPSMQRLVSSIVRISRISNALLWLTSNDEYKEESCVITMLDNVLLESQNRISAHKLSITVENINNCQPTMLMPDQVLELILLNLVNNVIHHGKQQKSTIALNIQVCDKEVIFCNKSADTDEENQHFGLGLQLISKLAKRFNVGFVTETTNNQFKAVLSYR